jgi:hypothetical protein
MQSYILIMILSLAGAHETSYQAAYQFGPFAGQSVCEDAAKKIEGSYNSRQSMPAPYVCVLQGPTWSR